MEWGTCFRTVVLDSIPWALTSWKDTVMVGLESGDIITLDGITGSLMATLSGHTCRVTSIAFSLDGMLLVSGSDDKTIKLWDVQTGGVVKTFYGHTNQVLSISISADCTMIASGSGDKTIRVWDIQTMECHCIIEQQNQVDCVDFSPTNRLSLISASSGKVQQWDIDGRPIGPVHDGCDVIFSSNSLQFVSCQETTIVVRNSDSGAVMTELHTANNDVHHPCFSPDCRLIAGAADTIIYVWNISGSDTYLIETFVGHAEFITSLRFSSPSFLISLSTDQSVKFWQIGTLPTDKVVPDPQALSPTPASIKFITLQARDGIAISGDSDGVVRTWDISTGFCRASFQTPPKYPLWSNARLIGDTLIFAWWADQKIHICDVESGELLQEVGAPGWDVDKIRISGDGSKVFCVYWTSIKAWSIQTGEFIGKVGLDEPQRSLTVDGSRIWVYSTLPEPQGWDFGIPGSPPTLVPNTPPSHSSDTMLWDTVLSRIRGAANGKLLFQLGGGFAKHADVQWDGHYLVAGYTSGEVLILNFNHMLPQ